MVLVVDDISVCTIMLSAIVFAAPVAMVAICFICLAVFIALFYLW